MTDPDRIDLGPPLIKGGQGRSTPSIEFAAIVVIVCISLLSIAFVAGSVR